MQHRRISVSLSQHLQNGPVAKPVSWFVSGTVTYQPLIGIIVPQLTVSRRNNLTQFPSCQRPLAIALILLFIVPAYAVLPLGGTLLNELWLLDHQG